MEMRADVLAEMLEDTFMSGFRVGQHVQLLSEARVRELFAEQNLQAVLEEHMTAGPVQQ